MADDRAGGTALLEPLKEDRRRIETIVGRLRTADEPGARADLASELVRAVSRHEDTVERALVPELHGRLDERDVELQSRQRQQLREAMTVIHERTAHIDPRNVHASDPEGFEQAVDTVLEMLPSHLDAIDRAVASATGSLSADERRALAKAVEKAARNASERPVPPRTAVGRALSNLHVKLDHTVEDVATPHHPETDRLED
ncbi:MAG TPA: hemerythrin domain-containing protein [Acidimicrobiales bacterium]|nr:hemerythrin domain-containing protein [Acidimicrobiales bacterium]